MAHTLRPTPHALLAPVSRVLALGRRLPQRPVREPDDTDGLRPAAKLYLAAIVLAALGTAFITLSHATALSPDRAVLAIALAAAMTLAGLFPLPFVARTKLALDTAVLVAAVLLFEPAAALLIAGSGMALAQALRRQPLGQALFNSGLIVLVATTTSGLLAAAGWRADHLRFDHPGHLLLAAAAGLGLVALHSAVLGPIIALQTGTPLLEVWSSLLLGGARWHACAQLAEVGLGILLAGFAVTHVWPVALLLAAAGPLYQVLAWHRSRCRRLALHAAPGD